MSVSLREPLRGISPRERSEETAQTPAFSIRYVISPALARAPRGGHAVAVADSTLDYRWQGLRFGCPKGWADDTLVTLTAPGATMNLTVARDRHTGYLMAYAAAQEAAVAAQRLAGYQGQAPAAAHFGDVDAVVCERALQDRGGRALLQLQAFAAVGGDHIVVVTATGAKAGRAALHTTLSEVLGSLSLESS